MMNLIESKVDKLLQVIITNCLFLSFSLDWENLGRKRCQILLIQFKKERKKTFFLFLFLELERAEKNGFSRC
jgi:hypothetical protein